MSTPIFLVASGDLRLSANQVCWAAQEAAEQAFTKAVKQLGHEVQRAHPFQPEKGHGFIDGQRYGIDVFRNIPEKAPVVVVEALDVLADSPRVRCAMPTAASVAAESDARNLRRFSSDTAVPQLCAVLPVPRIEMVGTATGFHR